LLAEAKAHPGDAEPMMMISTLKTALIFLDMCGEETFYCFVVKKVKL
jgi:hypothetical protein